jgi:phage/plasmid-like protein (TIGR03299 family)
MEAVVQAASTKRKKAGFVTAGLLGRGERGFASIDLSRVVNLRIKRDPSRQESHLFGTWAHDGSAAYRVGLWNNRVECQNMLNMALASAGNAGLVVSIRHAGDVESSLEEARRVLGFVEQQAQQHVELMNDLGAVPIPAPVKKWLSTFGEQLIPIPPDMERPRSREEARDTIKSLFLGSRTLVGVPQSAYRAYQAVAEYADHSRPLRIGAETPAEVAADRRFRSITEGPASDLKARALELLRQEFLEPEKEVVNA